jgi:hypothetical protein
MMPIFAKMAVFRYTAGNFVEERGMTDGQETLQTRREGT